ncbi:TonB-dependent receptor [Arenicella sp. 4NH20-0111]
MLRLAQVVVLAPAVAATLNPIEAVAQQDTTLDEIVVVSKKKIFANQSTTESMLDKQNPITSVLSSINALPGVNVTEGDTFGFDDWSTTINLRGFQNSLSDQQVGITIDGFPNGESNYGGGSKANRFIDSSNLQGVDVSQGTADIGSRSLEALGGTLDFVTRTPSETAKSNIQFSAGDHDARRYAASYDTGSIFGDTTRMFVSASHQEATDWVNSAAENDRDHFAAKLVSEIGDTTITAYLAHDDVQEDNYQRITLAEFESDPDSDRLLDQWTGVPYIDQVHRRGWSTLRENTFAYLKFERQLENGLALKGGVYTHANEGRGDWVPPQIVNVANDNGGPESEIIGGSTTFGGPITGAIYFVDAAGNALSPREGCTSSITFPYGGAGSEYDPACYSSDAIAVQSYRHTHYQKDRVGITSDLAYQLTFGDFDNELRMGIWYEDQTREEFRDWHKITDTTVGPAFDAQPYYVQYDREYPREVFNYYIEDSLTMGSVTATVGIRQFFVDVERVDNFDTGNRSTLNSDSDVLFSGGLRIDSGIDGLELFASYSENYKALGDLVLERDAVDTTNVTPETSENVELGLRFQSNRMSATVTYFNNTFENRLQFFGAQTAGNIPNYTIGADGRYDNVGGIETDGFEVSGTYYASDSISLYSAFTYTNAEYVGTGLGNEADAALGIFPGNKVVNTPENSLVVSLDWKNDIYRAGLSAKYVDDRFIDIANTSVAKSYTTADLYFGMSGAAFGEALEGIDVSLVVNNLLDESYLGGISGFGAWIGAPRTAVLSFSADF